MGDSVFQSLIGRLKTPLFAELTTAMLRFQSLIGRLKTFDTTFEPSNRVALRMFQSLIGRLKTLAVRCSSRIVSMFQSLIGRLKTSNAAPAR